MLEQPTVPTYVVSLVLRPSGWRVYVSPCPDELKDGWPVSIVQAEEIARVATEVTDSQAAVTPYMIARNGTTQLRSTVESALSQAEEQAKSIPGLRKMLGEIQGQG